MFVFLFMAFSRTAAADGPYVDVFSPQGTVKKVRQASVRFSGQMVAFGDPRLEDPFTVDCTEKGAGRWADDRNWVYDFDRDLPAGVACKFTMRRGLRSLSGEAVTGQREFSFSTGGPAVIRSIPYEGSEHIDEEQVFILTLDCEPDEGSILSSAYFEVAGINERVGMRFIKGADREKLIKANPYWWPPLEDKPTNVIIQARQTFPNGAVVTLVWGAGVSSKGGVKTGEDQRLPFKTRGPFVARFSCGRENADRDCIPFLPMSLNFESPVDWEYASKITLKGGGRVYSPRKPEPGEEDGFVGRVEFDGPFPENTKFTVDVPSGIRDDAGRRLQNADKFPLSVRTDRYPPLAKFSARFGIIEAGDPVLPVTLRNVEPEVLGSILAAGGGMTGDVFGKVSGKASRIDGEKEAIGWLRKVDRAIRTVPLLAGVKGAWSFKVPKPNGASAFEVVGIPLKKPGLYVVEVESMALGEALLGKKRPMYVQTAALVTNLSAHFLKGKESSAVWVTRLDTGEPVAGAAVSVRDCQGKPLWEGVTGKDGVAYIDKELPEPARCDEPRDWDNISYMDTSYDRALSGLYGGMFVFARTDDDMTFVHTSWDEGIEPWRFGLYSGSDWDGHRTASTVFDRTLFRAGETVSMKHIIRKRVMAGFSLPGMDALPVAVAIVHTGSDQSYEFPLKWDTSGGIAETTWKIPPDAKLGNYEVRLLDALPAEGKTRPAYFQRRFLRSGGFRVEEFRIPMMKGVIQPPEAPLVNVTGFELDIQVSYLSGGGAAGLPVVLRSRPEARYVYFEDYPEFVFANGAVKEGVVKQYGEETARQPAPEVTAASLTLGEGGALRARVTNIPVKDVPQSVLTEVEYKDPSGENQTVSRTVPLWSSATVVGVKPDSWASSKDQFKFQVATLDTGGKPRPGARVKVDAFETKVYSHRRRMIGGFYSYEHVTETKKLGRLAEGVTDEKGLLLCEVKAPATGEITLQASCEDGAGNISVAHTTVWVTGDGDDWWFDVSDHDRMDVLPEKKRYELGDTASFQVRMPFREATALVTVQREGVMDRFVTKLTGKEPVVRIPVKPEYSPDVYVSVLCVRGRTGEFKPTALVDLGRPAYKLGMAQINVGWLSHELEVKTTVEREVYKVRENVPVKIKVRRADGGALPKDAEVAIAAVDEGLLELKDNESWDILTNMMGMRGCDVETSTAQMQVVGKRHYGLKALPSGGGGGSQRTRELFDTLLFWRGRLPLDRNGEATVTIPLGDSLSSFRVVAVATAGTGLFGSGHTMVRTTQDLVVMSGLPLLVRQGDRFRASFTVRNASGRAMELDVDARASSGNWEVNLPPVRLSLAAGSAKEAAWDMDVPAGLDGIDWVVTANESGDGGGATDSVRVSQKVVAAVPVQVFQATLTQLDRRVSIDVEKPADAEPGRGGVRLNVRDSLTDELDGVREYMKRYPYTCLEQNVSKAVALRDGKMWADIMARLPSYIDGEGLLKYFPSCFKGSEVLTAYVLSISDEAGWKIPDASLARLLEGTEGFVTGRVQRHSMLPTADLSIRKMAAVEALSRYKKATPRLLDSITVEPNLWPTSAVLDFINVLIRVDGIKDAQTRLSAARQVIRSRLNFQGTTLGFSTEGADYMWWLMVNADVNAVKSIITMMPFDDWQADMPRLLRGAVGRQVKGSWQTTTANAWGVLALEKFARKFEAAPVTGKTGATLAGGARSLDWQSSKDGGSMMFGWPKGREELSVSHVGTGGPWLTVQGLAAIPLDKPFSSGYRITRTVTPVMRKDKGRWSAGDVARVRLECDAQADMTWVVVSDPVPAGSTILGTGLGRDSRLLASGEKDEGWVWPAFEERSFEAFRAYYEFVPKGKWAVEYTLRLNNAGTFRMPETRVEALYSPEMMGEVPNAPFTVAP